MCINIENLNQANIGQVSIVAMKENKENLRQTKSISIVSMLNKEKLKQFESLIIVAL